MPVKNYERRADVVKGLLYNGNNKAEVMEFCPEITDQGGQLYLGQQMVMPGYYVWSQSGNWYATNDFEDNFKPYQGPV